ncbi:MAG TPA: hypothetical protein VMF68_00795 [Spirochaetia bacterium]|nr:hypothetical protein [Spirochaetia bacterium]
MNRSLLSRILPYLLGFYALALAAFFLYSLLTFPGGQYLASLRWEYAAKRAFILFMDYLIPVHVAAVAVAASLSWEAPRPGEPPQPFSRIASSAVVAFLVLTVAYAALAEGVAPRTRARLDEMSYASRTAAELRRQEDAAARRGDWNAAVEAADRYLQLDPGNRSMIEQRLAAKTRAARQAAPAATPTPAAGPSVDEADAQALVERARYYVSQKDWFSAHYYAQAAVAADPRRRDALEIMSQAAAALAAAPAATTPTQSQFFALKRDALDRLERGDAVGAYYAFQSLHGQNADDPDVSRYLDQAAAALRRTSFFLDEARRVELLPGTQGIVFLNRWDAESAEAVAISKMVELPDGEAYFYGIEAIRYDADGGVTWHFTAPYGKRVENAVLMSAVDRGGPSVPVQPLYLQGARAPAERTVLRLQPGAEELRVLSSGRPALASMNLAEMWRLRNRLASYGLARQSLGVEMSMRLVMPFAFLVLSILATALGWALRLRTGRLSAAGVVLLPLLPVVLGLLSLLYLHAHRLVIGFTVIGFGLSTAFIALAVLQVVLLAVSLALLAGQSSR